MKKIISAILSLSLLAGVAAMPAAAAETYSLGDVDMNGVVDLHDAMLVCREFSRSCLSSYPECSILSEQQLALADVYPNDHLNINRPVDGRDGICVLQYYVYSVMVDAPISPDVFFANIEYYDDVLF